MIAEYCGGKLRHGGLIRLTRFQTWTNKLTKRKNCLLCTENNFRWDIRRKSWIFYGSAVPIGPRLPHCWGFEVTLRHTTVGMTPLEEWSAGSRDIYLTILNTHKRLTSMPPAGLEPQLATGRTPTRFRARPLGLARSVLLWPVPLTLVKKKRCNFTVTSSNNFNTGFSISRCTLEIGLIDI